MVKLILLNGRKWAMNEKLQKELDILIDDVIHSQMDLFIVFDGEEGSGKSYAARGFGKYIQMRLKEAGIDRPFNANNIHFRGKEYVEASKNGQKFDILNMDEGRALGRRRDKLTSEYVNWVSRCRFKQQFHIICIPAYHDLNPYIGEWRMRACIHFKKSYHKTTLNNKPVFKLQHGEFKLYCDLEGLRFNSRFRNYQYPKGWEVWDRWSAKEVFNEEELGEYNAKKAYYATLTEAEEANFRYSENQDSGTPA